MVTSDIKIAMMVYVDNTVSAIYLSSYLRKPYYLNGNGSRDPDDDKLNYYWTQTAGKNVTLSATGCYSSDGPKIQIKM